MASLIRATRQRYAAFGRACRLIPPRYFEQLALLRAKADAPSRGDEIAVKAPAENKAARRGADRIGLVWASTVHRPTNPLARFWLLRFGHIIGDVDIAGRQQLRTLRRLQPGCCKLQCVRSKWLSRTVARGLDPRVHLLSGKDAPVKHGDDAGEWVNMAGTHCSTSAATHHSEFMTRAMRDKPQAVVGGRQCNRVRMYRLTW
jgi:protein involved in temperature-dependent protein secretion